jgi:hypothetical protein
MISSLRKLARPWAVVFILANLLNVLAPTISWALTSGPTAPEATSFEPVDTTDMVSLSTGDFTYSIPLLEVPGPAGGYPLSLSYHAGIQPNEDASWVGLGWTLNPGAITRLTNGLPDDFDGASSSNRVYWQGGEITTTTVGISIGIANVATVSAGLSFSQDTYRGFGVGGQLGGSLGLKFKVGGGLGGSVGINATVGISPYGDAYSSVGIGLSIGTTGSGISVSSSVGLSINSSGNVNAGLQGGVGLSSGPRGGKEKNESFGGSLLGASIGTGGGGGVLSAAGFTSAANNSKDGKITTSENSWSVDIPVWYGINISLGRSHIRYWMDETVNLKNYGSLNFPPAEQTQNDKVVYDSYHVQGVESIKTGNNPEKYLEGSYADYDQYGVNAQGLVGNIRPHHYVLSLYSQDIIKESDGTKEVLNYNIPQHAVGVQYRFVNDFSNKITNNPADIEPNKTYVQTYWTQPTDNPQINAWKERVVDDYNTNNAVTTTIPLFFPYSNPQTGLDGSDQKRYVPNVPGSKNVEYFTNQDIISYENSLGTTNVVPNLKPRGFIECNAQGFNRSSQGNNGKVGAFTITNQSGVNYHFSLPAYAYDEYTYSGSVDDKGKLSYNVVSQPGKYAYTWYLTGMTGPDYVDRGPTGSADNILNEYDWGYWVDFQYGKWTDNFQWRNPSDGFNQDIDHRFKSFSMGKKEVYYLNAIKTKTHTALFIKEIRADGKGVDDINYPVNGTTVNQGGKFTYWPKASLKLKRIMVFNNFDLSSLDIEHGYYDHYTPYFTEEDCIRIDDERGGTYNCKQVEHESYVHYGHNVLDEGDLVSIGAKVNNSIRQVDFTSDYSLAPGTFNSFDPSGVIYPVRNASGTNLTTTYANQKLGKLTLNSITFKGKGGLDFLPSIKFNYDFTNKENLSGVVSYVNSADKSAFVTINGLANQFSLGDLVTFNQGAKTFYGYIANPVSSGLTIKFISLVPVSGILSNFSRTKNPPYDKDLTDIWGMYKVDFINSIGSNLNNYPTELSTKNADAWSLRQIENSTGSQTIIEYESDSYSESVLENLTIKLDPYVGGQAPIPCPNPDPYSFSLDRPFVVLMKASSPPGISMNFDKRFQIGESVNVAVDVSYVSYNSYGGSPANKSMYQASVVGVSKNEIVLSSCGVLSVLDNAPIFERGMMSLKSSSQNFGGGVRVAALSVKNTLNGDVTSTKYQYEFDGLSSGATSFEPVSQYVDGKLKTFFNFENLLKVFSLARDIPSPGVFYKKVRVSESIKRIDESILIPGFSEYIFEPFSSSMIDYTRTSINNTNSVGSHKQTFFQTIKTRKVELKDFTQRVGKLKSVTLYDKDGRKVNETINHYLHDEQADQSYYSNSTEYRHLLSRFNQQGLIHETFNHARVAKKTGTLSYDLLGIISKKENYPAVQTGTTSINYKTGIKTESKTLAFDFYNGNISKSIETDGYGNNYVTEINYAYNTYPAMGLKSDYFNNSGIQYSTTNKHMIDQQSGSTTFRVASSRDLSPTSLVSASAQTWSDQTYVHGISANELASKQPGIWRQKSSFSFIGGDQNVPLAATGDGLQPMTAFTPFNAWSDNATVPSGWQKNAEITKYDFNSHAIEAKDINDQFAATKFTYDHSQVLATAANAKYEELAYSGAEEPLQTDQLFNSSSFNFKAVGGGVYISGNATLSPSSHTGAFSVQANPGQKSFMYSFKPTTGTTYQVSTWISQNNAQIKYRLDNGADQIASAQPIKTAGTWNQIIATIPVSGVFNKLEVWCEANGTTTLFDDFRIHPYKAAMTSYVYNNWGELTHILDNNNLYTEYKYDEMGRLKETYKESFQANTQGVSKISEINYNYGLKNATPFKVTISTGVATNTSGVPQMGGSGVISPSVQVLQGGNATISAANRCDNLATRFYADGKLLLNTYGSMVTLYDGAKAYVDGDACKLTGVLGDHTVKAEFEGPEPAPLILHKADCEMDGDCYTGMYILSTWNNECGIFEREPGLRIKSQLPDDIRNTVNNCINSTNSDCSTRIRK